MQPIRHTSRRLNQAITLIVRLYDRIDTLEEEKKPIAEQLEIQPKAAREKIGELTKKANRFLERDESVPKFDSVLALLMFDS